MLRQGITFLNELIFEGKFGKVPEPRSVGFGMIADNIILFLLLLKNSVLIQHLRLHQMVAVLRHT